MISFGLNAKAFFDHSPEGSSSNFGMDGPEWTVQTVPPKQITVPDLVLRKGSFRTTIGCGGLPSPREKRVRGSEDKSSEPVLGPQRRVTASPARGYSCTPSGQPLAAHWLRRLRRASSLNSSQCVTKCLLPSGGRLMLCSAKKLSKKASLAEAMFLKGAIAVPFSPNKGFWVN